MTRVSEYMVYRTCAQQPNNVRIPLNLCSPMMHHSTNHCNISVCFYYFMEYIDVGNTINKNISYLKKKLLIYCLSN